MREHVEVLRAWIRGENVATEAFCQAVDAAIASLSAPQAGEWVLVPRDVAPEMWEAGMNCHSPDDTQRDYLEKTWDAMLAAAPQPPAEAQPVAYADPQAFANFKERGHLGGPHGREWMWAKPDAGLVPLYTAPPPSAPVGVPVDVVREYLAARACYEAATRPPNSHAPAPTLKHGSPAALWLRDARVALDNATTLAQQSDAGNPTSPPAEAHPAGGDELVEAEGEVYARRELEPEIQHEFRPHTPPPSASVEIASLPALWRQREDNGEEHSEYDLGFETASDECARMLEEALAQQGTHPKPQAQDDVQ